MGNATTNDDDDAREFINPHTLSKRFGVPSARLYTAIKNGALQVQYVEGFMLVEESEATKYLQNWTPGNTWRRFTQEEKNIVARMELRGDPWEKILAAIQLTRPSTTMDAVRDLSHRLIEVNRKKRREYRRSKRAAKRNPHAAPDSVSTSTSTPAIAQESADKPTNKLVDVSIGSAVFKINLATAKAILQFLAGI